MGTVTGVKVTREGEALNQAHCFQVCPTEDQSDTCRQLLLASPFLQFLGLERKRNRAENMGSHFSPKF